MLSEPSAGRFLLGELPKLLVGQLAAMWPNIPHCRHIIEDIWSPLSLILDIPFLGELGPLNFEAFDPFFPLPLPSDFPWELPDLDYEWLPDAVT